MVTNYLPTLGGEGAMAHLVGAAYQMFVMHDAPTPARLYPISMTEVMANLCETLLVSHLNKSVCQGTDAVPTESLAALKWQALRRITNCCLPIPARHRLLCSILKARSQNALCLSEIGELSKEAWRFYFGDSTDEVDRYIWAYKPHFYRREPVFYDWQYTLGFLLSEALCERFEKFGSSACGANLRQVYLDSGVMTLQEFGKRHLGTDLTAGDFWQHAVNTALAPIDFCLANPDLFCRKNS